MVSILASTWGWVVLLFFGIIPNAIASNILISSLYGEGSHFMLGASIGEGLVEKGHNVTCLISRAFEHRATDPRYGNLSFEIFEHHDRSLKEVRDLFFHFNTVALQGLQSQLMDTITRFMRTLARDCEAILKDGALMKRLERIDVIVLDVTWPCGIIIKDMIEQNLNRTKNVKAVSVSPCPPQAMFLYIMGSAYNPSYQPEFMSGFSNRMTFFQRTSNILQSAMFIALGNLYTMPYYSEVARKVGLNPEIANFFNWPGKFDLNLLSMDFSSGFPFPLAPNFIPVGGLTASPAKQLDQVQASFTRPSIMHQNDTQA